LPKHFHAQRISYYLFRLALNVWVYEGDVVVAAYDIAER
jgi:hypothetical protein